MLAPLHTASIQRPHLFEKLRNSGAGSLNEPPPPNRTLDATYAAPHLRPCAGYNPHSPFTRHGSISTTTPQAHHAISRHTLGLRPRRAAWISQYADRITLTTNTPQQNAPILKSTPQTNIDGNTTMLRARPQVPPSIGGYHSHSSSDQCQSGQIGRHPYHHNQTLRPTPCDGSSR